MKYRHRLPPSPIALIALIALTPGLACAQAAPAADAARDPTAWPPALRAAIAAEAASAAGSAPASAVRQLMFVGGHAYLVVAGRRYGVGEHFGEALITRIDETGVWLREGATTRHERLFSGVEKRPAAQARTPVPPPNAKKTGRAPAAAQEKP